MPVGISTEVEGGYALIDFLDTAKRGPALARLLQQGAPIQIDTSGRRKRYRVPEGNAREAGLIDEPKKAVAKKATPPPPTATPKKAPPAKKAAKKAPAKTAPPKQESDGLQDKTPQAAVARAAGDSNINPKDPAASDAREAAGSAKVG
jgi:hypothetical protein